MTIYYVRKTGSDAANGTSAGTAWATIGKALGASGIASGDTVYIGAGVYRERVTIAMTSATGTTNIIGDVDGAQTGDAGEVQWTSYTTNDLTPQTTGITLTLNGKDFLAFSKIVFVSGFANNSIIDATTTTSTDCSFTDCAFITQGDVAVAHTIGAGVAANCTYNRCIFFGMTRNVTAGRMLVTLNRHTVDYDVNFLVQNCIFLGSPSQAIRIASTGSGVGFGGGVDLLNCSFLAVQTAMATVDANLSTSIPCTVTNCYLFAGVGANANTSGQITENYNGFCCSTTLTNVTAGANSTSLGPPLVHVGQESIWGGLLRPFGMPTVGSPLLGFGSTSGGGNSAPSVDFLNRTRPAGMRLVAAGTATAGGNKTLTDSGATWGTNAWAGYTVQLTGGTGSGQTKQIASNTGTVLTVDGNWKANPDNTSVYQIYWGDPSTTGKATAGAASTLTDSNAAWGTNQWTGYTISLDSGTGSGQTATIASNTATVITRPGTWSTNPDNTTTYSIYKATGVTTQDYACGALERQDTAQKETTTTDAGGVGIRIVGAGSHEIRLPVNATSTTITVRVRYDSTHGTGSKPQAILVANGEIGVSTETQTAVGSAGAFETLTFNAFTPTAKGWVILRLVSRSAASNGIAYFDTVTVS